MISFFAVISFSFDLSLFCAILFPNFKILFLSLSKEIKFYVFKFEIFFFGYWILLHF